VNSNMMNIFVQTVKQHPLDLLRNANKHTSRNSFHLLKNVGIRLFSAVAEEDLSIANSPSHRKPSRRRKIDPLIVTENAATRIKDLLASENGLGALGVRLGVKRRGCNGLSYTLNYTFEESEKDEMVAAHGVKVFIEPMALFSVVGTVMDYEDNDLTSEFTFVNPNSKGECGCGESFNV